jgi:hypothetical protein
VEVLLGEFRDMFTEIAVPKVVGRFLRMIQSADYSAVMIDLRGDRLWDPSEGECAIILTLSFLAVFRSRMTLPSISKVNGEYSTSVAAMGWAACALRRAKAEILEGPRCLFNLLGSRKDGHPDLIEQRLLS